MSSGSGAVSSEGFWILADRGRAVWLPPRGRGNGLSAYAWLKIAEVPADWVDAIFAALASEGVAAWAAERDTMLVRSRRLRRRLFSSDSAWCLYVDSLARGRAEIVLLSELPNLRR
jgi:hypothetical protein